MRLPGDPTVGDYVAGVIALGCGAAVLVLWFLHGKWVAVGAGLMAIAFWAYLRVETGRWFDDFGEFEITLKDRSPTE